MKLLVDYSKHPAFQGLVPAAERNLPAARSYFDALDEAWREAVAARASADPALQRFDRAQAEAVRKLDAALAPRISVDYLVFVQQALQQAAAAVRLEIAQVLSARRQVAAGKAAAIRQQLIDTSAAGFQMEPPLLAELVEALTPFREAVLEQCRTNGGARCFVAPPASGEHWRIMKAFLREEGIEDGISAYAGHRLELQGYALTYSHPDEDWYRKCYLDIGLPAPKTVQMHYDEDNLSAKSMFYLNDVEEENGPFSYCAASRSEIASRSQLAFFKYLDFANNGYAAARGTPGTSYNRPLFIAPALRREFARLPAEMQGSGGPGDDVVDGSPLSGFLLGSERRLTGPAGYLALFAGGETLHRGGIVRKGERWALQMIYKTPPGLRQRAVTRLRSVLHRLRRKVRTGK